MKRSEIVFSDNHVESKNIYDIPDECPICHRGIDPHIHFGFHDSDKLNKTDCLQIVYRCTFKDCRSLFIAYYLSDGSNYYYTYSKPINKQGKKFSETINSVSPSFTNIYNQALVAEQDGLSEICGGGYRKALEFLIKDYLIKNDPEKKKEIEEKLLGKCIEDYIQNKNIKDMAKRATWLGNDETHYMRKWGDKDLSDMKKLMDATLYWIDMEELAKSVLGTMPDK